MTDDELADLKAEATAIRDQHDPAQQSHNYNRCEHCHFTSHPCDAYDMADAVLRLLATGR